MALIGAYIVPHPPLIVNEIGRGEQLQIQKTIDAYQVVAKQIALLKPDTIILSTPHSVLYSDYFHISPGRSAEGDFRMFGAPSVKMKVDYDTDLVNLMISNAQKYHIEAGTSGQKDKSLDHGTMVPLYFVNQYYQSYKLVRISLSSFSPLVHYRYGKAIEEAINQSDKKVIWIASGDLSHKLKKDGPYGLSKEGPIFDEELTKAISEGNFMKLLTFDEDFCEKAAECGLRSFIMMAGALDGKKIESNLMSYEGPFGVGYAVASFNIVGFDESRHFDQIYEATEKKKLNKIKKNEDAFVSLARQSLEYFIKYGKPLKRPYDLTDELINEKAGVFVSIKMDERLRGCIGTIHPTTHCIADEIIQNAISSGTQDYRFNSVSERELPYLVYSVDVLGQPELIQSIDELDVKRYGVIVRFGGKSGLLLPNLEGIDTPEEQVSIALRKGGIKEDYPYTMQRFEVVRHK
ncbi:MAG: AmmeMemoRadiSam system protein A [Acholeplasmataceae bacterium]|nr:AmmeMemoRadiSam system protein A [Acholeplasmataceae bacterium]